MRASLTRMRATSGATAPSGRPRRALCSPLDAAATANEKTKSAPTKTTAIIVRTIIIIVARLGQKAAGWLVAASPGRRDTAPQRQLRPSAVGDVLAIFGVSLEAF